MVRFEDILLILVVALLLFGPGKMIEFAKGLGSAMREFKKAASMDPDQASTNVSAQAALPVKPAGPAEAKPAESKEHSVIS
jgi:sec-independent protein translocase protein TatA